MDVKSAQLSHLPGLGSWHPAMRPDSYSEVQNHRKEPSLPANQSWEQEGEDPRLAPAQKAAAVDINVQLSHSQECSSPELHRDARQAQDAKDLPPSSINHTHMAPASYSAVSRDEGAGDNLDLQTSSKVPTQDVWNAASSEEEIDGSSSQHTGGDRNGQIRFPDSIDNQSDLGKYFSSIATDLGSQEITGRGQSDMREQLQKHRNIPDYLGAINRTNSFPEVPPLRHTDALPPHPLSQSQAEDILVGNGEDIEIGKEILGSGLRTEENKDIPDLFTADVDEDESGFFANISDLQPGVVDSPADEEARFEEGLPLLSSESHHRPLMDDQSGGMEDTHSSLPSIAKADESDLLSKISDSSVEESDAFIPQQLDRKSTTQVLASVQYPPAHATHDEPHQILGDPYQINLRQDDHAIPEYAPNTQPLAEAQAEETEPDSQHHFFEQGSKDEDLDAIWQAALGDDEFLNENDSSADPSSFFDDDGEGFLEDSQDAQVDRFPSEQGFPPVLEPAYGFDDTLQSGGGGLNYGKGTVPTSQQSYGPIPYSQPLTHGTSASFLNKTNGVPTQQFGISHSISAPTGFAHAPRPQSSFAPASSLTRPPMPESTQSFSDKSKGGYTSPYDLPMDVARPRKRTYQQQMPPGQHVQAPSDRAAPPRSSSMYARGSPNIDSPPPLPAIASASLSPIIAHPLPPTLKAKSSFFEELPSVVKSRPSTGLGKAASQNFPPQFSRQTTLQNEIQNTPPLLQRSTSSSSGPSQAYQLLPPERMSPYANTPQQEPVRQAVPAVNSRYSPAPTAQSAVPPTRNRYASSPAGGPRPQPPPTLPFQPRTSSPLAQNISIPQEGLVPQQHRQAMDSRIPPNPLLPAMQQEPITAGFHDSSQLNRPSPSQSTSQYTPSSTSPSSSPYVAPNHEPSRLPPGSTLPYSNSHDQPQSISNTPNFSLPQRSQTQSPGALRSRLDTSKDVSVPYQRPSSVTQYLSARADAVPSISMLHGGRPRNASSATVNYIRPSDGRENDELERWKGCPIFTFGFGGATVSSFPKQIPRYAAGQSVAMVKCSPGEVKVYTGKIFPVEESIAAFPGPLRSKSKKKEVLDWLIKRTLELESTAIMNTQPSILPDPRKRHEEKIILWRIIQVLVEYDGVIEGNQAAEKAVRVILSPELATGDNAQVPSYNSNAPLVGISRSSGSLDLSEPRDPEALESLRKILLHGEREKAVWHAVDRRLWAHAMLLASTLDKTIWKQVLQEFNTQEVKGFGQNTESLAALYQILAGNWEESVDQLVPPSARAGLQMVSKAAVAGPTKNALDGLDRWRETLTLVLSNRTQEDGNALVALGRLMAGYGRIEAAHVCYIFAQSPGLFGGPDDPQVSVVLLGADHMQQPYEYSRDIDSILLTEIYDFARTVLAPSAVMTVSPHLQSYKLYHALILAEYGYRSEAQSYCDAIMGALKSTTKLSPYYHKQLFGALEDLDTRLRQSPKDTSGSRIAIPSMDKVSGSVWARLNQFIAGDESDAESAASGKGVDLASGPFAKIAGDSPSLSRTPSSNDLYGSYPTVGGIPPPLPMTVASTSRYAPTSQYTPRTSLEQPGRPSHEFKGTVQNGLYQQQSAMYQSTSQASTYTPITNTYLPPTPAQSEYVPTVPQDDQSPHFKHESYQPSLPSEPHPIQSSYHPEPNSQPSTGYTPFSSEPNPEASEYEPPIYTYEPPSYDPESNDTGESSEQKSPKKKKSFMYGDDDDDEDFAAKAAVALKKSKSQKDRDTDEAFRKAAEADAQKQPSLNSKKSWWGGLFGTRKDSGDLNQAPSNAPIRAKLGEKSSFYYDKELKKWVNQKGENTTTVASPTPPPPRAPPSRATSGAGPPASTSAGTPPVPPLPAMVTSVGNLTNSPPSLGGDPASSKPQTGTIRSNFPAIAAQPTTDAEPAIPTLSAPTLLQPGLGPPSAPPSRPSTGMSNASSIDDLIGLPQARKAGTVKKAKKGRGYIDVMAK